MIKNHRLYLYPCLCLALLTSVACSEQDAGEQSLAAPTPSVINVSNDEPANAANAIQDQQPVQVAGAPQAIQNVFSTYCIDCHGPSQQKGDVRFDNLDTLDEAARTELFTTAHQVLEFEEMPPDNKPQPSEDERATLIEWVQSQVDSTTAAAAAAELEDKLRYPHYGNLVDHETLFSGEIHEHAFTHARRWLVSPQIFHERVMDVFRLEGRDRDTFATRSFYGVTNPFVLSDDSGVRDYDIGSLSGGHLLVMLNNAQWIASKQIFAARLEIENREELLAALSSQDRWYPRTTPEAFAVVMRSEGAPTEEQMIAAIQEQFDCVLRRQATDDEVHRYLGLLRESIVLGGNTEGLKRMMVAVLLESEFLYRLELGGGEVDAYGRQMLTPREGAYAISYALGDRGPDDALMQAAAEGRLETREDYEREVRRLLADENYYRGQVDPALNGMHYQSNVTSHPRTVRFFREFFGYPNAVKVFKDPPRIGGMYQNPGRGTLGSPGWIILEADRIVTEHIERDENVFVNLLTFDEFYVYQNMDDDAGVQLLDGWRGMWEALKDTDWRTNPAQVYEANQEMIAAVPRISIRQDRAADDFLRWMYFFSESFGQGRNPFTREPWSHGYYYMHSSLYSIGETPSAGRYNGVANNNFNGFGETPEFWDYQPVQPFAIEHRMGILTHPAWLIAHSSNFHSDPIRRGRWIREKLLAGRVPDVPITVDAVVPEDPEHTFRERVERVTTAEACWGCHQHMNPLGLPFESFDDFGRYRTVEDLEHPDNLITEGSTHGQLPVYPTAPIDSTGAITETGYPDLDSDVDNAFELIDRIAHSDLARQSIIRHAFRFYMGRNERLSDSQTLIDADRAYIESGGSFEAVIVSILTSDSFLYRKTIEGE